MGRRNGFRSRPISHYRFDLAPNTVFAVSVFAVSDGTVVTASDETFRGDHIRSKVLIGEWRNWQTCHPETVVPISGYLWVRLPPPRPIVLWWEVAQLAAQITLNDKVVGSRPTFPTNLRCSWTVATIFSITKRSSPSSAAKLIAEFYFYWKIRSVFTTWFVRNKILFGGMRELAKRLPWKGSAPEMGAWVRDPLPPPFLRHRMFNSCSLHKYSARKHALFNLQNHK